MPLGLALVIVLAGGAALMPVLARRRARRSEPRNSRHLRDRYVPDSDRDALAERRGRALLRSVAGDEVADMYEQLGFVGVRLAGAEAGTGGSATKDPDYGYLLYPHRPIVAYDQRSGELLSEYCVRFPDGGGDPAAGEWLPDADDVLAKWLGLEADEHRLIGEANMHLPGRQLDPAMVRRDLAALRRWRETTGGTDTSETGAEGAAS